MSIEYRLLERGNGDHALVCVHVGIFKIRARYYHVYGGFWSDTPKWYDNDAAKKKLDKAFKFFCTCGEVKVLKSCGGKK